MLFDILKEAAATKGLSDVKVKEGDPVRIRINNVVEELDYGNVSREQVFELLRANEQPSAINDKNALELLEEGGDFDFVVRAGKVRYRTSIYFTNGRRLALAMRHIADKAPKLSALGLPDSYARHILPRTKGLVLITGETGSGKTTTLASTLEYFNDTRAGHIITLEDPVEYLLQSRGCMVDQREVGPGRDSSDFRRGLRAALREDPDIILIGELRDAETIRTALTAAQTGHLVLATLHTNNAIQSIERMAGEFPANERDGIYMVMSQALIGIVSQTLVTMADGSGRALAAEILVATPDVQQAIKEGKPNNILNSMDTGSSKGHVQLNTTLRNMVRGGLIKAEDALNATYDPARLRKELGIA